MINVQVFCFLASYVVALGSELVRLRGRSAAARLVALGFAAAGLVAQTMYLWTRGRSAHVPPLLSSPHDWILVLAWLAVLFYVFLSLWDRELSLGPFVLPVVLAMIGVTYFMSPTLQPRELLDARRGWGMLHAALLVLGMAAAGGAFVSGMMYLVQHRRLKQKHAGHAGLRIPSLERLARANRWAVLAAFPLLTLGFFSGLGLQWFVPGQAAGPEVRWTDPLVVTSAAMWILMASLVFWLLVTARPAGRQVAWLTIWLTGFLFLTVSGLLIGAGTFHTHAASVEVPA